MTIPDEPDAVPDALAAPGLDEAFRVADRLAVHGADCVCPPCAGRLPRLLAELARALDRG
ncbi:hypothetical protein [Actinomycetospora sp. TBRC 11914]|uniref:hypothetical protein n=1 Tax=Actinomycetospora sp. TBRC 11914 TaxID=2729387 RepID=UPI00145C64F8|nr:hypothetical protein [Actinomycetospora sp. TBRC 11914]NMO88519.1 hypothetical protein [Actinomycetospora sp. TBRC 11914]